MRDWLKYKFFSFDFNQKSKKYWMETVCGLLFYLLISNSEELVLLFFYKNRLFYSKN